MAWESLSRMSGAASVAPLLKGQHFHHLTSASCTGDSHLLSFTTPQCGLDGNLLQYNCESL